MWRAFGTIVFICAICLAIYFSESETWQAIWFILLLFLGLPLVLLLLRDLFVLVTPKWLGRGQVLLHTCAIFAAFVGYGVGWMAVDSGHPKAHLHQLFVVAFALFVYATPILMLFHGLPV